MISTLPKNSWKCACRYILLKFGHWWKTSDSTIANFALYVMARCVSYGITINNYTWTSRERFRFVVLVGAFPTSLWRLPLFHVMVAKAESFHLPWMWVTMNLENWDNLPWTNRGRKFKNIVEFVAMTVAILAVAGISGMWQSWDSFLYSLALVALILA